MSDTMDSEGTFQRRLGREANVRIQVVAGRSFVPITFVEEGVTAPK